MADNAHKSSLNTKQHSAVEIEILTPLARMRVFLGSDDGGIAPGVTDSNSAPSISIKNFPEPHLKQTDLSVKFETVAGQTENKTLGTGPTNLTKTTAAPHWFECKFNNIEEVSFMAFLDLFGLETAVALEKIYPRWFEMPKPLRSPKQSL